MVVSDVGIRGKPILQVGGEQDVVTVPAPTEGVETPQVIVQFAAVEITSGEDAVQVRGILLRTGPPFVFGREVMPAISVRMAVAFCEVPFDATKVVSPGRLVPAGPTCKVMF